MYITHWYQGHIQQRELEVGQQIQSAQSELAQELNVAISNPSSALPTSGADGASRDGNRVGEGGPWMVHTRSKAAKRKLAPTANNTTQSQLDF